MIQAIYDVLFSDSITGFIVYSAALIMVESIAVIIWWKCGDSQITDTVLEITVPVGMAIIPALCLVSAATGSKATYTILAVILLSILLGFIYMIFIVPIVVAAFGSILRHAPAGSSTASIYNVEHTKLGCIGSTTYTSKWCTQDGSNCSSCTDGDDDRSNLMYDSYKCPACKSKIPNGVNKFECKCGASILRICRARNKIASFRTYTDTDNSEDII